MCGLAGVLDPAGLVARPREAVEGMAARLAARGPDAAGSWDAPEDRIALGFRRLAVQDLSALGDQPMESPSGRFVAVLNGEIHNFLELRAELERDGVRFRSRSDTEVMLAQFDRLGVPAALPTFIGMFAIAVWDRRERELWLVRDRLGVKPLSIGLLSRDAAPPPIDPLEPWRIEGRALAFASDLRAFRSLPSMPLDPDREALAGYLDTGCVPAPRTMLRCVRKLPPGCLMRVRREGDGWIARPSAWWSVAEAATRRSADGETLDDDAVADSIESLLRDAVARRLVADVPRGVFLSGGVDSAAVAALVAKEGGSGTRAFSIAFEDPAFDESDHARSTAGRLGLPFESIPFGADDAPASLEDLVESFDEPFADSSALPMRHLCRAARGAVTVALTGDGGDEVFGGYERYRAVPSLWRTIAAMPMPLRRTAAATLGRLPVAAAERVLRPLLAAMPTPFSTARPATRVRQLAALLDARSPEDLHRRLLRFGPGPGVMVDPATPAARILDDPRFGPATLQADADNRDESLAEALMRADLVGYLPDDLLVKADRASMASGLELREPLLDHRVVEAMLALPLRFKVSGATTKPLLRRIVEERLALPLPRQPKMGFAVPLATWLRGPLREACGDLLAAAAAPPHGWLMPGAREALERDLARDVHRSADRIWTAMMYEAWRRRWDVA